MFAATARATRRAIATAASRVDPARVATPSRRVASASAPWRVAAATMASMPLAVETGAHAAAYLGGLLNPNDIARIKHDLATMPRSRIEGADVPRAVAMVIPLCHDVDGTPHALFTSRPDDFGAPHAGFPTAPRSVHDSGDVAAAIATAREELGLGAPRGGGGGGGGGNAGDAAREEGSGTGSAAEHEDVAVLGSTSDVPCVATQRAVTPVVAYLGRVDIATMQGLNALEGRSPTIMALRRVLPTPTGPRTVRPCRRGARRSSRTFPGASLRRAGPSLGFNPDASQLHH
jgi:hypothetical protein